MSKQTNPKTHRGWELWDGWSAEDAFLRIGALPEDGSERSRSSGIFQGWAPSTGPADDAAMVRLNSLRALRTQLGVPSNFQEAGVCVFSAILFRDEDGEEVLYVVDTDKGPMLRGTFGMLAASNRDLFRAWGEVVGRGANGEPLLRDASLEPVPLNVPVQLDHPHPGALADAFNDWRLRDHRAGNRSRVNSGRWYRAFYPVLMEYHRSGVNPCDMGSLPEEKLKLPWFIEYM